jgi:hypothetical protein
VIGNENGLLVGSLLAIVTVPVNVPVTAVDHAVHVDQVSSVHSEGLFGLNPIGRTPFVLPV